LRAQGFEEWTDAFEERVTPIEDRITPLEKAVQQFSKSQEQKVESKSASDPRVDELLAREQQRNYDMQIEALKSRHPDFIEVSDSDSFKVFVASLPEEVAHVVKTSTNANVASYYLDLYKSQSSGKTRAQVDAERGGKLRGAVNPIRGQASGKRTVVSEDDMTPEQLFDYRARLEAKQR
jgi:vacuolar-type H+-ATPase subunit I/STV1